MTGTFCREASRRTAARVFRFSVLYLPILLLALTLDRV